MRQILIESKHGIKSVIFDDRDYALVSSHRWHIAKGTRTFYAQAANGVFMHSMLINSEFVDHADGNGLNNTRINIRACTKTENNRNAKLSKNNKSGFKGVSFEKARDKWVARLGYGHKTHIIGRFGSKIEAARAYNVAAIHHHGDFAKLNVLPEEIIINPCIYGWITTTYNRPRRV